MKTKLDEKEFKLKQFELLLRQKNDTIKEMTTTMSFLDEELDKYYSLVENLSSLPKEWLEKLSKGLLVENEKRISNEEIVMYSVGLFLKDLVEMNHVKESC